MIVCAIAYGSEKKYETFNTTVFCFFFELAWKGLNLVIAAKPTFVKSLPKKTLYK
jgi:hypothetical protein